MQAMASPASSTQQLLRVTATHDPGTHVVEVRRFSKLRKNHRGDLCSETFTVAGLDWTLRFHPDGEVDDDQGYASVFVNLATEGAAAWAHVTFGLVDWSTGQTDTFFAREDPVLFDAGRMDCCSWGTGKLASWRKDLRRSRYLRRDTLRVECAIAVCRDRLAFHDAPTPRSTPRHERAAGELGSPEGADVLVHAGGAADEPPFPVHSSVLDAYAPRFLKKHNLGRRRRPNQAADVEAMRVNVDDMPRPAVAALLQFVYTDTLPVVAGLSTDGYRDMFRHLLLAARRYGMRRLAAISERVLCRCVDIETAAATLAMAEQHRFEKLREACFEFVSDPENYSLVRESKGYGKMLRASCLLAVDVWKKYRERSGLLSDENGMEWLHLR